MSFLQGSGPAVIFDTEFTSWPGFRDRGFKEPGRYREVIQIGAVKIDIGDGFREMGACAILVRPTVNPILSDYIQDLTGITQAMVDEDGATFTDGLSDFLDFIGDDARAVMAYGTDVEVLFENCRLNDLPLPALPPSVNVREELVALGLVDHEVFSSDLPEHFGLAADFPKHDALGDARAIALALRHLRENGTI